MSLEAPLVAVGWLTALAGAHGLLLMPEVYAGLFGVVWAIYLIDRILDAGGWLSGRPWTARHHFCLRHRRTLLLGVLPVLAGLSMWLAFFRVPGVLLWHCLGIAGVVAGYLGWHVMIRGKVAAEGRECSKSLLASALFALGVCAGVYAHEYRYSGWAMVAGEVLLTGLFGTNLFGLAILERERAGQGVKQLEMARLAIRWVTLAVALVVWLPLPEPDQPLRLLALSVVAGVLAMSALHVRRAGLSEISYRCLVDAVLLAAAGLLYGLSG